MGQIREVQRIKIGYNPGSGQYKPVNYKLGERIDEDRVASWQPIKRFDGSYRKGGVIKLGKGTPYNPNQDANNIETGDTSSIDYSDPTNDSVKSRFSGLKGLGKKLTGLLPYASNIANSFRRLPNPIAPPMENAIAPNLVSYDADRANLNNDFRSFGRETDYRIANPTIAQAVKAAALGRKITGENQLAQQEGNTNAFIKNQTAQANQGVNARNIERTREFNDQTISRNINQQRLLSENLANFSDKAQLSERDKAQFALENRKLDVLPTLYKDTGVYERNYKDLTEKEKEELSRTHKFGGYLKSVKGTAVPLKKRKN